MIGRYSLSRRIDGGKAISASKASVTLYRATINGDLRVTERVLEEGERLDTIAQEVYGASSMWWLIAGASGIGWALQVPPGTLLRIPTNASEALTLLL
tara:strand:- start:1979 stop:2272 length:294 start_codon:yes stop_codon:yes gene_type:complete